MVDIPLRKKTAGAQWMALIFVAFMCQRLLAALLMLMGIVVPAQWTEAASLSRWSISLTGPDRVSAGRDYTYRVTVTDDGSAGSSSINAQTSLRLAFDLTERFGEGTVGVTDVIVHPTGPQLADGSFPCAMNGGCWFRRIGSQIAFTFTPTNTKVPPVVFDIIVHTASIFRPGNSFTVSATLQHGPQESFSTTDPAVNAKEIEGDTVAIVVAQFPIPCGQFRETVPWGSDLADACLDSSTQPNGG